MKIEKIKTYEAADTYALSHGFSKGENIYLQKKKPQSLNVPEKVLRDLKNSNNHSIEHSLKNSSRQIRKNTLEKRNVSCIH